MAVIDYKKNRAYLVYEFNRNNQMKTGHQYINCGMSFKTK